MNGTVTIESGSTVERAAASVPMNKLDAFLAEMPQADLPVFHRFTKGMYARQIFVPKGTFVTTKIHQTEHQFVITQGDISVWTEGEGIQRLVAPHFGITTPGTRRAAYANEDTVWTTFHPTEETDLEKIESVLIYPHDPSNPALVEEIFAALIKESSQ